MRRLKIFCWVSSGVRSGSPLTMNGRLATLAVSALLLPALAACDFFYVATARVPLVVPADTSCLRSELGAGTRYSRLKAGGVADSRVSVVSYATPAMFHNEWQTLTEARWRDSSIYQGAVYRDSGAVLASSLVQVNRRITPAQAAGASALITEFLLDLRHRCGGRSPDDEPLFSFDVNETQYRTWVVRGTRGHVAMRLTVDSRRYFLQFPRNPGRYVLRLDTLADESLPRVPRWLPADTVVLPPPFKNTAFAVECSRGDSAPTGDIVALVRESETQYDTTVLDAWALDRSARRLHRVGVDGLECRNGDWGALPDAPSALRAAALTFRPTPGMARIYALLDWPDFPMENAVARVAVDRQAVGWLEGGSFLMVELPAGQHRVSAVDGKHENALAVEVAADSSYFVELRTDKFAMTTGWRAKVQPMDASPARAQIRAAHMTSSSWPGTPLHTGN